MKGPVRALTISLCLLAFLLLPAAAGAVKPLIFHDNFHEEFEEELCGIPVSGVAAGVDNFKVFFDQSGTEVRVLGTSQIEVTWTNPENGNTVTLTSAGRFSGTATENPDGTVTFTDTYTGIPERIRISPSEVLVMDVGRIAFETTIDFGDPEDPDDDTIVSAETVFIAGPHPEAESDFALFCEAVESALL